MIPVRKGAATREQLVDATERLMCEGGLSAVTTQSVARACGLSEGTIYRHFSSREELIVTTLRERLPGEFKTHVDALSAGAGRVPLDQNLGAFISGLLPIFATVAPSLGMLAADPTLAAKNAESLCADGKGPRLLIDQVAEYLRAEQRLGRVAAGINVRATAGLLVALCFYRSLMAHLFDEDPIGLGDKALAAAVAGIIERGIGAPATSGHVKRGAVSRTLKTKTKRLAGKG